MIGVPRIMTLRTRSGFSQPVQVSAPNQSAPRPRQGSYDIDPHSYPKPVAANGPDWGIGVNYLGEWVPSHLEDGYFYVERANYGISGSLTTPGYQGEIGDPQLAGATETSNNKVRTIRWQGDALSTFIPQLPQWNVLPPGTYYNGQVPSIKANRTYSAVMTKQSNAGPLNFQAPGVASLVQQGLSGS